MRRGRAIVLVVLVVLASAAVPSGAATADPSLTLSRVMHGRAAIRALGSDLPAAASLNGMGTAAFARLLRRDPTAWVDRGVRLFYVEGAPPRADAAGIATDQSAAIASTTSTPSGVPILHSLAGASNVLYLDFDGETISGTAWNVGSADPLEALPFDRDGDLTTFSDEEVGHIYQTWQRVAEDYAPYAIDVTTEQPPGYGSTVGHVLVTLTTDANGVLMPHADTAGGTAYLNVFGRTDYAYYSPALVYSDNLFSADYNIAEAASHEFGHHLSLRHDGTSTSAYYSGAGTYAQPTSWAPIMGTAYYKNVTKFNNGDYPDANNREDDEAIVASKLGRRTDDVGPTFGTSSGLAVSASSVTGAGIIGASDEQDLWGFQTAGGTVNLGVSPLVIGYGTRGGDLDVKVALLNASGQTVAVDGAIDRTDGSISAEVPAGTYFVRVAADASDVSSAYGSQGQYWITGSIPGAYTIPSASLESAPAVTSTGVASNTFDVAYFDLDQIDVASLGTGDVRVTGPNGFSQIATFVAVTPAAAGSPARIATYRVAAPGGTWDSPDNGTYAVSVEASQVRDTLGNAVPAGQIGSYTAALQRKVLYNATMSTNPGWSLMPDWAYGVPTASAGPTDRPVVGDTIKGTGLYADGIRTTTATTPSFSTSGMTSVTFTTDTFLGVRSDDVASIDVGVGGKWTTIWSNAGGSVLDTGWTLRTFDISSIAANRSNVQIRFVLGPTKSAPAKVSTVSFGWNVASLQVTGR